MEKESRSPFLSRRVHLHKFRVKGNSLREVHGVVAAQKALVRHEASPPARRLISMLLGGLLGHRGQDAEAGC